MEYEFDYYLINNTGEPNVPSLKCNDEIISKGIRFIHKREHVDIKEPVYLTLNPPIPSKPNLDVDYLQLPSAVFSQKIYDALSPLNIEGYQLVPAIITGKKTRPFGKTKEYKNFWIENAYTRLESFDKENSIYEICPLTKRWGKIEKILIDRKILENIPLRNRLVFRSMETFEFVFYHKTVVDAIMSVDPINIRFTSIEDWYEGHQFKY